LADSSGFLIVEQRFEDEKWEVRHASLNLIKKIRSYSTLSVFNFFYSRVHMFPGVFFQHPSKQEQMEHIKLFAHFIKCGGDLVDSHISSILDFLWRVLEHRPQPSTSLVNKINEHGDRHYDRWTRIWVLRCLSYLCKLNIRLEMIPSQRISLILDQLSYFQHSSLKLAVIETLRSLFRRLPAVKLLNAEESVQLHQTLFQYLKPRTHNDVQIAVMRLFGTIGALDPRAFRSSKNAEDYPLYDRAKREHSYLTFVMKYVLDQLKEGGQNYEFAPLITAVLYIFQSDPSKCLVYLPDVVNIFRSLLLTSAYPLNLFHFLRSLLVIVDINILPFADTIYHMLLPYLRPEGHLSSLKPLAALIHVLKTNFQRYGPEMFAIIDQLLQTKDLFDFDSEVMLLLTFTLTTVYANGSPIIFFKRISERVAKGMPVAEFAVRELCKALRCCDFTDLLIPSLKLARNLRNSGVDRLVQLASELLALLAVRFPRLIGSLPNLVRDQLFPDFDELVCL
jgi:hypothetical protein